ncbi:MAG: DNA repair protein RecN [Clostridia bacterium]|nr:DNA repair protein RecN [Clostridia bacterium]
MLVSLHIENVATIKAVDIEFDYGFTVLSGETGAGKSIIIDSVNLLLGDKSNRDLIRSGETTASVTAIFTALSDKKIKKIEENGIPCDGELSVYREIGVNGRSLIKCNGRSVPAYSLRAIMKELITIHGQNSSSSLLDEDTHLELLDSYAEDELLLADYRKSFDELNDAVNEQRSLIMDEREKQRLTDDLNRQIAEIEEASLKDGEEDELLAAKTRIKNLEQTAKYVKSVYRNLYHSEKSPSACERIDAAINALTSLNETEQSEKIAARIAKLDGFRYEIEDIAETTRELLDGIGEDPAETLDAIETRLTVINRLKRKYGADIAEILAYHAQLKDRLKSIKEADGRIAELSDIIKKKKAEALSKAAALTEARKAAAASLGKAVSSELKYLDLQKVKFEISVTLKKQLSSDGADSVVFMAATNTGDELKPIDRIASGGEMSRIMLAIKSVFAGKDDIDTVIYDEVDAGISGATSERIGDRLHKSAEGCQVIAVTHSAQVASCADSHILIYKTDVGGRTQTFCRTLDREERINELARIIGGVQITRKVMDTAAEMIKDKDNKPKGTQ